MGTYFNFMIRNRLIDLMRKEIRTQETTEEIVSATSTLLTEGNQQKRSGRNTTLPTRSDISLQDEPLWQKLKQHLTTNQWLWVRCFVVEEMSIKEIATQEKTTIDAVKGWARQARRKLRDEQFRAQIGWDIG